MCIIKSNMAKRRQKLEDEIADLYNRIDNTDDTEEIRELGKKIIVREHQLQKLNKTKRK